MFGITLIGFATVLAYETYRFLAKAVEVPGEVIRLEQRGHLEHRKKNPSRTVVCFYPVIKYQGPDGKSQTLYNGSGSYPPRFYQGQRVIVLVDPGDPDYPLSARIKSVPESWMFPMVLGSIGIMSIFMSWVFWLASKPKKQATQSTA